MPVGRPWKMISLLVRLCPGPGTPPRTVSGRDLAPAPRPRSPGPHGEEMSSSTTAEAGQPVPALASLARGPARPPGHPAGGARQMGKGPASPGPPCPWNMARRPVSTTVPRACPPLPGSDPPAGEAPRGGGGQPLLGRPAHRSRLEGHSAALSSQSLPTPPCPWPGRDPRRGGPLGRQGCGCLRRKKRRWGGRAWL